MKTEFISWQCKAVYCTLCRSFSAFHRIHDHYCCGDLFSQTNASKHKIDLFDMHETFLVAVCVSQFVYLRATARSPSTPNLSKWFPIIESKLFSFFFRKLIAFSLIFFDASWNGHYPPQMIYSDDGQTVRSILFLCDRFDDYAIAVQWPITKLNCNQNWTGWERLYEQNVRCH